MTSLELTLRKDESFTTSLEALYEIFRRLKPGEPMSDEGVKITLFKNSLIQSVMT